MADPQHLLPEILTPCISTLFVMSPTHIQSLLLKIVSLKVNSPVSVLACLTSLLLLCDAWW